MSPDRGSSERDPRPEQVSGEEARTVPATSTSLMDASHAGTLSAGCEALFRSTETTLQWAWRVLKCAKAGPGAGPLATSARQCALEFLDRVPPHVRRGVAELLGYSSLWQAVCTRLGRPVARSTEELQHELGEDLQSCSTAPRRGWGPPPRWSRGSWSTWGGCAIPAGGSRARRWSCARPWTPSPTPCPS